MKKNIKLRIALLIAVAFLSGGAVGFFTGQYVPPCFCAKKPGPPPPPSPSRIKNMMRHRFFKRLQLSEEQCKKADSVIDNWYEQMDKLRRAHAPDYQAVFSEFFDNLKPILTPEQNQELEKIREEIKNQHFRYGKRSRGRSKKRYRKPSGEQQKTNSPEEKEKQTEKNTEKDDFQT